MKKSSNLITDNIAGVNQILPHTHKWAWDLYLTAIANTWNPTEISMQKDIEQWKGKVLTDDERLMVNRCMGFFAGSESLVSNNLLLSVFKYITDGECRNYISRQIFEESLHNLTVVYVCDSLQLNIDEVYQAYSSIPSVKVKDDFLMKITTDINRQGFTASTIEGKRELLKNLFTYYIICEGLFFYSGFAMLLSLHRQNKMPGIGEQIQYTMKDENLHVTFGTNLINTIRGQYPKVWTQDFENEMVSNIEQAVLLEIAFAKDTLPSGILGLNSAMIEEYVYHLAGRRLNALGIKSKYSDIKSPLEWLTEVIELGKQKNFFETRVTEYNQNIQDDL